MNNNSKAVIRHCRIIAAVAVLTAVLKLTSGADVLGTVVKYSAFALLTLFAGYDFKSKKSDCPKGYTVLATALMLAFTVFLSYVLPSHSQNIEITPLNIISIAFLAPVFEELFFRGALISFEKAPHTILFSSLIFALLHSGAFFQSLLLGILLSYFYVVSRKISVSIICHSANNILALICMWHDIRIPVLVICVIVVCIQNRSKK